MLFKTSEMRLFFLDFIDFASGIFRFLENYSHTIIVKKRPTNRNHKTPTLATRNSQAHLPSSSVSVWSQLWVANILSSSARMMTGLNGIYGWAQNVVSGESAKSQLQITTTKLEMPHTTLLVAPPSFSLFSHSPQHQDLTY